MVALGWLTSWHPYLHSPKESFVEGVADLRRRQRLPGARQAVLPAVKAPMTGACIDHVGRTG